MPPNEIVVVTDNRKLLEEKIEELRKRSVLVGIPETSGPEMAGGGPAGGSRGGTISNATLGYIHELGSVAQKIPPRPWLRPGVTESRNQWEPHMVHALKLALEIKSAPADIDKALNRAGLVASTAVKRHIRTKIPPPLKPATIMARRKRHPGRKAGKPMPGETKFQAASRAAGVEKTLIEFNVNTGKFTKKQVLVGSDVTPLVDTAQFLNSITYVVKKDG